ncbi:MAG: alpha/beta hydrolase [Myxococcales bacterium]
MPSVDTPAGTLWIEQRGTGGPSLLWWPGLFCQASVFEQVVRELPGFRHTLIDPPGHGRSTASRFSLDDCATALLQIADQNGDEGCLVVGQSWGAVVALKAALRAPRRIAGLVLLHPIAEPDPWWVRLKNRMLLAMVTLLGMGRVTRSAIARTVFSPQTPRSVVTEAFATTSGWSRRGLARAVRAVLLERQGFLFSLQQLRLPVEILVGRDDQAFPAPFGLRTAAAIRGARHVVIDGVGHMSPLEDPCAVRRAVQRASARWQASAEPPCDSTSAADRQEAAGPSATSL